MKAFWYIVCIVTFYNLAITCFNTFRYRMKLAAYDKHEWVICMNYACGIVILMSVIPTFIIFTLMLLKNGLFNPITFEEFHTIGGTVLGININRLKAVTNHIYHPFTYAMFICFCNAAFQFKNVCDRFTERYLRYHYLMYWAYTVAVYYLIRIK